MSFSGFPKQTTAFLSGLSRHNEKTWLDAHRADYDAYYIAPAVAFVEAIGPRLKKLDRAVQAVPKVNGSISRINRDVRFRKDKTPYKDRLELFFWSGKEKGWDNPGFFFRLTPSELVLGAGMYMFSPDALARYRKAVAGPRGVELAKRIAVLEKKGFDVGGERYKKVPRGFDEDHLRARLLKHSGLFVGWHGLHPKELHTPSFIDFVIKKLTPLVPVQAWLKKTL